MWLDYSKMTVFVLIEDLIIGGKRSARRRYKTQNITHKKCDSATTPLGRSCPQFLFNLNKSRLPGKLRSRSTRKYNFLFEILNLGSQYD